LKDSHIEHIIWIRSCKFADTAKDVQVTAVTDKGDYRVVVIYSNGSNVSNKGSEQVCLHSATFSLLESSVMAEIQSRHHCHHCNELPFIAISKVRRTASKIGFVLLRNSQISLRAANKSFESLRRHKFQKG
jgi:hypothetical protein